MNISNDVKLDFDDVLLVPRQSAIQSRSEVNLAKELIAPHTGARFITSGVIAANMDGVGTFEVANVLRGEGAMTALRKHYSVDELVNYLEADDSGMTFVSMGISDADFNKLVAVSERTTVDKICIDVANGYMNTFLDTIARVREAFPLAIIMAGNVVTSDGAVAVYQAGADIVKVGIGPGAMCTTRLVTGVGYPQLSAIMDIVAEADQLGFLICSDGGCSTPGHVAIAMAAGADMVMLGTMLAGTREGGGIVQNGSVQFYGMSSKTANETYNGGLQNYRSSEGRTSQVPFKGDMIDVIQNIHGGLRSTCSYLGVRELEHLPLFATAVRVRNTHNTSHTKFTTGN